MRTIIINYRTRYNISSISEYNFNFSGLQSHSFGQKLLCFIKSLLEIIFHTEYNLTCENMPELIRKTIDARSYCVQYIFVNNFR